MDDFKSRTFGSNVPKKLKRKIQALQAVSQKNRNPNDSIEDVELKEIFGSTENLRNIGGNLSSRTPFARMWTAVQVAQSIQKSQQPSSLKNYELEKNEFIKDGKVRMWSYLPKSQRVYTVGNHILNTLTVQPGTQVQTPAIKDDKDKVIANVAIAKSIIPSVNETDQNRLMKPPAGITSVSCKTDGKRFPHTLKKTTVEFQVHNFSDYERIYTRYFLRPGAQIFIDIGWDTSYLYSPEELLAGGPDGKLKPEEFLYDEKKGFVPNSNGDLETLVGFVTEYSSKVRPDGGFDCSIEILSKNGAIVSNTVDEALKKRMEYGLDIEILALAVSGVMNRSDVYTYAKKYASSDSSLRTKKDLVDVFKQLAKSVGLGNSSMMPAAGYAKDAKQVSKWGVYYGTNYSGPNELYVNFGFFEDKILNKELGFHDVFDKETSDAEGNLKSKFNSRNSFITYNKYLYKAMKAREDAVSCPFLYPGQWGKDYPTYNTLRNMIPEDRIGNEYSPRTTSTYGDIGTYPYPSGMTENDTIEDIDRKRNRIPIREIFLKVKTIKELVKSSNTVSELINGLCEKINNFSKDIIDLVPSTNSYAAHTLCFLDKMVVKDLHTSDVGTSFDERAKFLKNLLTFSPYSPDSIVKDYNLDFSMPQGGLGNMLAIQATGTTDTKAMGVNSVLNGLISMEEVERFRASKDAKDLYVKWIPKIGDEAGRRLRQNLQLGNINSFSFNENDIVFAGVDNSGWTGVNKSMSEVTIKYDGKEITSDVVEIIKNTLDGEKNPLGKKVEEDDDREYIKAVKAQNLSQQAANQAAEQGDVLVDSIFDYYMMIASQEYSNTVLPLIEAKLSLTIHGISGLMPGDLITVDYLPEQYYTSAFFQIMSIEQNVSRDTWSTTLETQMRLLPSMSKLSISAQDLIKVKINKTQALITSVPEAVDIGEVDALNSQLAFLDNLTPIPKDEAFGQDKLDLVQNISDVYSTEFIVDGYQYLDTQYSFIQIADKKIYNKFKGQPENNSKEEKALPKAGSFVYDVTNYNWYNGPQKKVWIEDKGYQWLADKNTPKGASGTLGAVTDYVYTFNIDKSTFLKGTKIFIVASKKKNWYFLPPSMALLLKHGPTIDEFFVKGQEAYNEQKLEEKDKAAAEKQLRADLQKQVDKGRLTPEELDAIIENI